MFRISRFQVSVYDNANLMDGLECMGRMEDLK